MKFDANLRWLFTELPFEQRFEAAASAGFAAVEYPSPYEYEAARLRELLQAAGVEQVLINTPMGAPDSPTRSGIACFPDRVEEFRDGVLLALEYAVALGSEFVHVVGGIRPEGVDRDRAFAQYVVNIGWAAEQARGTGVRLLLEVQNKMDAPRFILDTEQQAAAVVEAVGSPDVGVLFDLYHVQMDGANVVETAAAVWSSVFHIQIADPPARSEPGSGEIDWAAAFGFLRESGYDGWIGCEYRPLADTVSGLSWMSRLI